MPLSTSVRTALEDCNMILLGFWDVNFLTGIEFLASF